VAVKNFLLFIAGLILAVAIGGCASFGLADYGPGYRAESDFASILAAPRSPIGLSTSRNHEKTGLLGALSDSFWGRVKEQKSSSEFPVAARDKNRVLRGSGPLVVVCISGGGSRADRFAAHVLDILEQGYKQTLKERREQHPKPNGNESFVDHIDAFSTVSGGSVYAAYVANQLAANQLAANPSANQSLFNKVRNSNSSRRMGAMAAEMYLSPGNLFLPVLNNILTDRHYLDLLAFTTEFSFRIDRGGIPVATPLRGTWISLAELPARPFFLFNSTCVETGFPFVISQVPLHSSWETGFEAWKVFNIAIAPQKRSYEALGKFYSDLALSRRKEGGLTGILPTRLLLEDIGTEPRGFTLADAAIASAAFPAYQPMKFTVYKTNGNREFTGGQAKHIHLSDGGIFDNSGIDTALELYYSLTEMKKRAKSEEKERELILIYVNANNDIYESYEQRLKDAYTLPFDWQFPISGVYKFFKSMDEIHSTNKLRAEYIFTQEIKANPNIRFYRIDISRLLLKPIAVEYDRRLRAIPTNFAIGKAEDELLQWAAQRALDCEERNKDGDEVWYPGGGTRMDAILNDILSHPDVASR
jgi:hypothetical protein